MKHGFRAVALVLLAASPVAAQADGRLADSSRVEGLEIVPLRGDVELRELIAETRTAERRAERAISAAEDAKDRAEAEVRILKRDEDAIKARVDLAEDEGRDADVEALEAQREQIRFEIEVLEKMRSVHDERRKLGQADRDAARARFEALESELQLLDRRRRVIDLGRDPGLDVDYLAAERRLLELQRDAARKVRDAGSRAEGLAKKRLDALKVIEERRKD